MPPSGRELPACQPLADICAAGNAVRRLPTMIKAGFVPRWSARRSNAMMMGEIKRLLNFVGIVHGIYT
jgi:hypothetical protein